MDSSVPAPSARPLALSSRRQMLRLFGVLSVGAALAACAAPAPSPTAAPPKPTTPPAPTAAKAEAPKPAPATEAPKPAPATQAPVAKTAEKVSVRLDWLVGGQHAPYFIAREKGYYKEVGLDVDIGEAQGSTQVMQLVGNKNATFGNAEGVAMLKGISQSIPGKAVAAYSRSSPMGFSSLKATGIKTPKDLEGKTYGIVSSGASAAMWPVFAKVNNVDVDKVKLVNIDPANADRLVLAGQIDFTDANAGAEEARYTAAGKEGAFMSFRDNGLIIVGFGMVAHNDTIKEKPNVIRGFVKATLQGIEEARKDPQGAVDLLVKAYPSMQEARKQQALEALKGGLLANLDSPNTKGKPLGWMSDKDWQGTIDALVATNGLPKALDLKDVFTNEFIPGS